MNNVSNSCLRMVQVLTTVISLSAATAPPDFSGKWMLDSSQSQGISGEKIELTIQNTSGKIDYDRVLHEKDGKESHITFLCEPVGKPCDLKENGHKAKVSLWYAGSALMMAKTGGPSHDATTERKLELSPDGKTLTVSFTNFSGDSKEQKLVFTKQ